MRNGPTFLSWIVLTLLYPPPGTPIWVNTEHIVYYGKNIVSEKGKGTAIFVVAGGKFAVMETPEEIARLIAASKEAEIITLPEFMPKPPQGKQ